MPHVDKVTIYVLHNESDWDRYWSSVLMNGATKPDGSEVPAKPSAVDWKTTELVAIHFGSRPNGPYKFQVSSVVKRLHEYLITVTEIPPQGMAFMHVTYPFVIVEVPAGVDKASLNVIRAPVQRIGGHGRTLAPSGGGG